MLFDSSGTTKYASYQYIGSGTIVSISHPQVTGNLVLSYGANGTYAGWDRFGRVVQQLWKVNGTTVDGYCYTYDRSSNVTMKTNVMNSSFSECYAYDGLSRLIDFDRGGANAQAWSLDSLGNWSSYTTGATTQTRTANEANEITDLSTTGNDPTYDLAGNMTSAPLAGDENTVQYYAYNAWNKMTGVYGDSNRTITIALYEYDGLGRRIQKYTSASTLDTYLNESWQEVETRKNADPDAQDKYVYDLRYIDAPVARLHDDNTDGDLLDAGDNTLYYTQDANFNVMSLITTAGSVTERYVYTPYGMVTVLESNFIADADNKSDYGNVKLFQGVIQDAETLLYYARNRYRHIDLSWTQRDPNPEGIYADGMNFYGFVKSNPIDRYDPSGLYGPAGHYYTVYIVALAVGNPAVRARQLAYFSQLPDQDKLYEATAAWWDFDGNNKDTYSLDILRGLHGLNYCLNASNIKKYRDNLKELYNKEKSYWKRGFILHAFGDSYAHLRDRRSGREQAFLLDHATALHAPDNIYDDVYGDNGYIAYVNELFTFLGGNPGNVKQSNSLNGFISYISTATSKKNWDEYEDLLSYAISVGYSRNYDEYRPDREWGKIDVSSVEGGMGSITVNGWKDTQFNKMHGMYKPTKSEVQALLDEILSGFTK